MISFSKHFALKWRFYYATINRYSSVIFWGKNVSHKNHLSTKIIMMVECIILISSMLFCTVSIYRARVGIRKSIQQRMLDIANCASGSVNGDVLGELGPDDIGSQKYTDVYNTLAVFRDNVELPCPHDAFKPDILGQLQVCIIVKNNRIIIEV